MNTNKMGIDYTGCEAIFHSFKYVENKKNILTLGRQGIHIPPNTVDYFLDKNHFPHLKNRYHWGFCENLFLDLGFNNIDSIDNSPYEGASIIHNMNTPIPNHLMQKYDYILDAGTTEHIFNMPQVCENIIDLLSPEGIYVSITPNNNLSGHGIYQFSPEFYLSAYSKKYGMEVKELYIAKVGSGINDWINVNDFNEKNDGRNISKFDTTEHVYVIAIIKKLTIDYKRENLITNSPNQYSYENIYWKK
jgi:SAM-dependent methyltransferase